MTQAARNEARAMCTKPPAGWRCTRGAGHDGPCAAVPLRTIDDAVNETERILRETMERASGEEGWMLTRLTKALEALADRPVAAPPLPAAPADTRSCICHPMAVFGEGRKTRAWFHRKDCPLHDAEDAARVSRQFNDMFVVAPAAPAGAAEAGDARRVMEAREAYYASNLPEILEPYEASAEILLSGECDDPKSAGMMMKQLIHYFTDATKLLAAARRLLDARAGAGVRIIHRSTRPFVALCGSNTHRQMTTETDAHVTCSACLKLMALATPAPATPATARAPAASSAAEGGK